MSNMKLFTDEERVNIIMSDESIHNQMDDIDILMTISYPLLREVVGENERYMWINEVKLNLERILS